jgi:hypothetical protein
MDYSATYEYRAREYIGCVLDDDVRRILFSTEEETRSIWRTHRHIIPNYNSHGGPGTISQLHAYAGGSTTCVIP